MNYLPASLPLPEPTIDDRGFWENCARKKLVFQACFSCGRFRHPPGARCPYCQSARLEWREAPSTGRVFTFTTVCHAAHPEVASTLPYNVSVVEFPECDGVRLITNVVGRPERVTIGASVELIWEEIDGNMSLPRFRLAGEQP